MRVAMPGCRRSSPCMTLIAARRGNTAWTASYTVPMPPRPISRTRRYEPTIESGPQLDEVVGRHGPSLCTKLAEQVARKRLSQFHERRWRVAPAHARPPQRAGWHAACSSRATMAISQVPLFDDRHERTLRTGDLISAYRIDRLVGAGGMGWVYRAEHVISSRVGRAQGPARGPARRGSLRRPHDARGVDPRVGLAPRHPAVLRVRPARRRAAVDRDGADRGRVAAASTCRAGRFRPRR